jgi:hypothetical protein
MSTEDLLQQGRPCGFFYNMGLLCLHVGFFLIKNNFVLEVQTKGFSSRTLGLSIALNPLKTDGCWHKIDYRLKCFTCSQSLVLESHVSYLLQSYLLAKSGKSHLQRVKTSYGSTREIESNGQDCISKMMRSRPQDHVSMSPGLCAYNDKICLTIVDFLLVYRY